MGDRRWSLFTTCVISTVGLVIAGLTIGLWWSLAGITIAAIGFYGTKGPFWSPPTMFLTGGAAAAGIAWINSLGNLGGFFGPSLVGLREGWPPRPIRGRCQPRWPMPSRTGSPSALGEASASASMRIAAYACSG